MQSLKDAIKHKVEDAKRYNDSMFERKKAIEMEEGYNSVKVNNVIRGASKEQVMNFVDDGDEFSTWVTFLEDGYCEANNFVLPKGATKRAVDAFNKAGKPILVNDSHTQIHESLLLATLGTITEMKTETFGDKNDKTRALAKVTMRKNHALSGTMIDLTRDVEGLSVSSEFEYNRADADVIDFGGEKVIQINDMKFTGMAICLQPAIANTFGTFTVNDSEGSNLNINSLDMADEKLVAEESSTEETSVVENEAEESVEESAEESVEEVAEEASEESGEEAAEESKEEEEKEEEKEEEEKEEEEEEKEEEKEEEENKVDMQEVVNNLREKLQNAAKAESKVEELTNSLQKSTDMVASLNQAYESLKKEVEQYKQENSRIRGHLAEFAGEVVPREENKATKEERDPFMEKLDNLIY